MFCMRERNRPPTTDQKNSTACHHRPTDQPPLHAFGLVETWNSYTHTHIAHVPKLRRRISVRCLYLVFHCHTFAYGTSMPSTIEERIFMLHVCSSFPMSVINRQCVHLAIQLPAIPFDAMRWWPLKNGNKLKFRIFMVSSAPSTQPTTHAHFRSFSFVSHFINSLASSCECSRQIDRIVKSNVETNKLAKPESRHIPIKIDSSNWKRSRHKIRETPNTYKSIDPS